MNIDKKKLYELRSTSKQLPPMIRIGKFGITDTVLQEITIHLKKRRLIKVKMLKNSSAISTDEAISLICERCKCTLIDKIGMTFSLYR